MLKRLLCTRTADMMSRSWQKTENKKSRMEEGCFS
jgi:hypothetical protein